MVKSGVVYIFDSFEGVLANGARFRISEVTDLVRAKHDHSVDGFVSFVETIDFCVKIDFVRLIC
jgi:hypothetical protein